VAAHHCHRRSSHRGRHHREARHYHLTRDDGTKQDTANGMPVYLFAKDTAPGDVKGTMITKAATG
jgi:predicted lipoprotein with Yx(FWY)xxD motif